MHSCVSARPASRLIPYKSRGSYSFAASDFSSAMRKKKLGSFDPSSALAHGWSVKDGSKIFVDYYSEIACGAMLEWQMS